MAFIVPIFTKLILTQEIFVDFFFAEFYPNGMKNTENKGKRVLPL